MRSGEVRTSVKRVRELPGRAGSTWSLLWSGGDITPANLQGMEARRESPAARLPLDTGHFIYVFTPHAVCKLLVDQSDPGKSHCSVAGMAFNCVEDHI